jgi:hypothetical protein
MVELLSKSSVPICIGIGHLSYDLFGWYGAGFALLFLVLVSIALERAAHRLQRQLPQGQVIELKD